MCHKSHIKTITGIRYFTHLRCLSGRIVSPLIVLGQFAILQFSETKRVGFPVPSEHFFSSHVRIVMSNFNVFFVMRYFYNYRFWASLHVARSLRVIQSRSARKLLCIMRTASRYLGRSKEQRELHDIKTSSRMTQ